MSALRTPAHREVCPPSHSRWIEEQDDEFEQLEARFTAWLDRLPRIEALFKKHVYENESATQLDFRQHRAFLFELLACGERIALDFLALKPDDEVKTHVQLIDQKIADLFSTLLEWHAPAKQPDDVPESFKQAMTELSEGKLMEFPSGKA